MSDPAELSPEAAPDPVPTVFPSSAWDGFTRCPDCYRKTVTIRNFGDALVCRFHYLGLACGFTIFRDSWMQYDALNLRRWKAVNDDPPREPEPGVPHPPFP